MIAALVLLPLLAGFSAFAVRADAPRRILLVAVAAVHLFLSALTFAYEPAPLFGGWIAQDALGRLFLILTSMVFLATAVYATGYLGREGREEHAADGFLFARNAPEAVFTGCMLLFLAAMTLVTTAHHFGLLWVAVEATTLASAPLIYYHRHQRSLEATWKYLVICSVGIALALLGNFFLAVAAGPAGGSMLLPDLLAAGVRLQSPWLKGAFLFFLVGYGTKMGLAPLHTWLPDTYSESPPLVAALLSGAFFNCSFLALLRSLSVCSAAGLSAFCQGHFVVFGLLSMGVAAVFLFGQADYKRLLAYSSVEHIGILALGTGLGAAGVSGALLHTVNHSLAKSALFLAAGNIAARVGTRTIGGARGLLKRIPVTGAIWIGGLFALSGVPPFGTFLSEFAILRAALAQGRHWVAGMYLALLALLFAALANAFLRMSLGAADGQASHGGAEAPARENRRAIGPPLALGFAVIVLGLWIPPILSRTIELAARGIGALP